MNATLLEALAALLAADPVISTIFAGLYLGQAAPGTVLPYLTLVQTGSEPTGIIGAVNSKRTYLDRVTVTFEVRTTAGDSDDLLKEQLRTALMRPQGTLGWNNGREVGRWLAGGESGELEAELGPNGTDVWVSRLPIGFTITRTA